MSWSTARPRSRLVLALFAATALASLSLPAHADDIVAQAKAKIAAATAHQTKWDGPTTGPKAAAGKTIVFVAADLNNSGIVGVSQGVDEAAKAIGWSLQVIDGQGTVSGRTSALNQAVALNPSGIILGGFDATEQAQTIAAAAAHKIPIVGWHAAPNPGPVAGTPLFTNVTTPASEVADIAAMYAIAQSNGHAGVVIFTDSEFSIALAKSNGMAALIKKCSGCTLLETVDTPIADTSTRMPQITTSLIQRYGSKWTYSLAINDLYYDFMVPTLASAGSMGKALQNISAGDGSTSAYYRIRGGHGQAATVPEPLNLQGWQLVDELNRAFHGDKPSGYVPPVHLVTKENIAFDGGPKNLYDPDDGYRDAYRKIWGK